MREACPLLTMCAVWMQRAAECLCVVWERERSFEAEYDGVADGGDGDDGDGDDDAAAASAGAGAVAVAAVVVVAAAAVMWAVAVEAPFQESTRAKNCSDRLFGSGPCGRRKSTALS